jgi:hypothetical protein
MGRITRLALFSVGLTMLGSMANAQGIRMTIQQVWSGLEPSRPNPYYANIENTGANTNGIISTDSSGNRVNIDYPVEIPSGSKKRVLFLSGTYNDGKVLLRTSSGSSEATIKGSYNSEQARYGLISDNPSDLIFLKGQTGGVPGDTNESYAVGIGGCVPDDAPDRSFGYNCLDALVLGDGTEKLRDGQVRAIKLFVQSGGSLVFVGGAAQSASNDPRWKDLLPISNPKVVTNNGLTEITGNLRQGTIATKVAKGTCLGRSYGAGIVSIISVNPFESPVRESEDRRSIMSRAVRWNHKDSFRQTVSGQIGQQDYRYSATPTFAPGYVPMTVSRGGTGFSSANSDPFQIKPPSLTSILWILVCYAIVVVPINFLILRKLKKLEIAWVSTPLISVIFSLFLLNSTIGLYKASATTRTTSVAILVDGGEEAMVFGKSEMFFPTAKSYDLELADVESVLSSESYGRDEAGGLDLRDDGRHLIAPDVRTANLAFKELGYVQTSSELKGLSISLVKQQGETYIKIENRSRSTVTGMTVFGTGLQKVIEKSVAPGASLVYPVKDIISSKTNPKNPEQTSGWQQLATTCPNKIVALASIDSMHVGPKYGAGHPSSQYMVVSIPQWRDSL